MRALGDRTGYPVFHNHLVVNLLVEVFTFGSPPFVRLRERMWLDTFVEAARIDRSIIFTFTPETTIPDGFSGRVQGVVAAAAGRVGRRLRAAHPGAVRGADHDQARVGAEAAGATVLQRLNQTGPSGYARPVPDPNHPEVAGSSTPAGGHDAEHPQLPQPIELPIGERDSSLSLRIQLTRFVLTGVLSAIVDFGVLSLLIALGLDYTPAKAMSFVCGTTTAYLINRRWTFRAEPSKRRFAAVVALYAATFAVQVGLFAWLYPTFIGYRLSEVEARVIAFVIAQGVATTVNFVVQRAIIFRLR